MERSEIKERLTGGAAAGAAGLLAGLAIGGLESASGAHAALILTPTGILLGLAGLFTGRKAVI